MAERQKHGFVFQKQVEKLYNYEADASYTAKWDMIIDDRFYSIKNIKLGAAIELGSLRRFYENTSEFTMIIAWHNTNQIIGVEEVVFTKEIIGKLKGTISSAEIFKACDTLTLSTFPLGKHYEAREYFKAWKKEHSDELGLLTVTGKVDSKVQRRWQCNINKTTWRSLFGPTHTDTVYKGFDFKNLTW